MVVTYLGAVLLPGGALLSLFRRRVLHRPLDLLEAFLFSNLAGLSMLMAIGWTAARFGVFSATGVAVGALVIGLVLVGTGSRAFFYQIRSCLAHARVGDVTFLGLAAVISTVLLIPAFAILAGGSQIGLDTYSFSRVGDVIAQTGSWPSLSAVWKPGVSQADMAPGLPILFATFGGLFGEPSIHLAVAENVIPFVLSALAMFLLVREFATSRLVAGAASIGWMLSNVGGTLLLNDLIAAGVSGTSPDTILSTPFFVALVVVCVRLVRSKQPSLGEVGLLSVILVAITLLSQLTFLMTAILLFVTAAVIAWRVGARWFAQAVAIIVVPVLAFLPDFLIPSAARAESPALTGQISLTWHSLLSWTSASVLYRQVEFLGFLGGILAIIGMAYALAWRIQRRPVSSTRDTRGALLLGVTGLIYLPFGLTILGSALLAISYNRFYEYPEILAVPFVAVAYQGTADSIVWIVRRFRNRGSASVSAVGRNWTGAKMATVAVALLLVASAVLASNVSYQDQQHALTSNRLYTPSMAAAGNWLRSNASPGSAIVADSNGGNTGIDGLIVYSGHLVLVRPYSLLYAVIQEGPLGLATAMINNVITDPSAANAELAFRTFNAQYYVFQHGYSTKQITAFSLLAYFPIVYENSQIVIFEFDPSNTNNSIFVPATSFSSASAKVSTKGYGSAYNASFSVPLSPNAVTSISSLGSKFNGSTVNYTLDIAEAGSYTLWVHRDVLQTQEYLRVEIGGIGVGQVTFSTLGWSLGSPLTIPLPAGKVSLTLTFEGTVRWSDPIDYLVLSAPST